MALDYTMFEIDELLLERTAIDKEIKERASEELDRLSARQVELMALTGKLPIHVKAPVIQPRHAGQAKYRHPDNGALTWTGRGPKPEWMKSWIAKGKDPNELLIPA